MALINIWNSNVICSYIITREELWILVFSEQLVDERLAWTSYYAFSFYFKLSCTHEVAIYAINLDIVKIWCVLEDMVLKPLVSRKQCIDEDEVHNCCLI